MKQRSEHLTRRQANAFHILLGLLALLFCPPRPARASAGTGVSVSEVDARFVIADFDGDVLPDVVSVHNELNGSGDTNYWIQMQLSEAGQRSIRLVAPAGGLFIQARDVNGDHVPDLLLATAWSKRPVAIFLNDGHGEFSRVAPDEFPSAFATVNQNWRSVGNEIVDLFGLPSQGRAVVCVPAKGPHRGRSPTARVASSRNYFRSQFLFGVSAGRAPPSNILA